MSLPDLYSRRDLLKALTGLGFFVLCPCGSSVAANEQSDYSRHFAAPLIHAPQDPGQWPAWRAELTDWREAMKTTLRYDDRRYRDAPSAWSASSFSSCLLMLWDQTFWDLKAGRFHVEPFLEQAEEEFGGYDNLILWHAYPRIGADERNQFDFYRDMPGGLDALREVVRQCHARNVRALIVYKPWDTGTRREPLSDVDMLASLVQAIGADGVYLDTMAQEPEGLRNRLDDVGTGLVLEGEGALPLERVHDHQLSWAQQFEDSPVPGILRNKWFERRHMMHQIARWNSDRTSELHQAWMNGSGAVVWENVFGSWRGWSARDRSQFKRMVAVQRRFQPIFSGEGWTPLVPTEINAVYATRWDGADVSLWTLVNRSDRPCSGTVLKVASNPICDYFDVMTGERLAPVIRDAIAHLALGLPPRGIGGVVQGSPQALGVDFDRFLAQQRRYATSSDQSSVVPHRPVALVVVQPTATYGPSDVPADMAKIPAATYRMKVRLRTRECGFYENVDHISGNLNQPREFDGTTVVGPFAIDLTPVTNRQFEEFLWSAGYEPRWPRNFLKHWVGRTAPRGKEHHPVVYVDLEDARAFAKWAGKRLPTEAEWQYAAQGPDAFLYPWGTEMVTGRCNAGETGTTTSVTAFPEGRSPFGCYDMCGNVWEWTESERADGRTRFCMIRGGSYYIARGSQWYMDGGPQPTNVAAKFLLMWPGLDRCATIGFRCVVDMAER
jgi:formylglycine-generating enzyme required for sulfatase activity